MNMSMSSMAAKFGTATGEHHENHQSESSPDAEEFEVEPTVARTNSTSSSSAVPPAGPSTLVQQLLVTKSSYNFGKANQNQGSKSTPRLVPPVSSFSSSSTNKNRYNIGSSSIDTKSSFNSGGASGYKKQKTNHGEHDTPLPQSLYTQRLDSILAQILESIPHDKDQVIR